MYDLTEQLSERTHFTKQHGFTTALKLDQMNNLFVASATLHVYKFNLRTDREKIDPTSVFTSPSKLWYDGQIDLCCNSRLLIAGSDEAKAHVWDTCDESNFNPFLSSHL